MERVAPIQTVVLHDPSVDVAALLSVALAAEAGVARTEKPSDAPAEVPGLPEYVKAIVDDMPTYSATNVGKALVVVKHLSDGDYRVEIAGTGVYEGPSVRLALAVAGDMREAVEKKLETFSDKEQT